MPGLPPPFQPIAPDAEGLPLFRVVKRSLLRAIESGAAPPGAALPSETELAQAMGVSIGTLRRAEHIVVRRQGRGTFVATHNVDRFLFQFFHVEREDGLQEVPQVDLLSFERSRIDEEAAAALSVREGDPAIVIENRLSLQGRAVIHDRLVLPAALFRGLTEAKFARRPSTIYHLYQTEYGITVVRAHERARAVPCERAVARVLALAPGAPVLKVRRTALTFGDKPVEYRISTLNTAHHEYVSMLQRPA
jgi:GntR family transcriptional regulator